jgi:succinate dehydrogenase/fumarate reductase flavoprotein subunit
MNALRRWILGVAFGCFAAGAVIGWAAHGEVQGGNAPSQEAVYAGEIAARYGLTQTQQWRLRLVLQHAAEQEIAILRSAQVHQLPPELMARLLALRSRTEQHVRALLDDEQRACYDRDSRPAGAQAPLENR